MNRREMMAATGAAGMIIVLPAVASERVLSRREALSYLNSRIPDMPAQWSHMPWHYAHGTKLRLALFQRGEDGLFDGEHYSALEARRFVLTEGNVAKLARDAEIVVEQIGAGMGGSRDYRYSYGPDGLNEVWHHHCYPGTRSGA